MPRKKAKTKKEEVTGENLIHIKLDYNEAIQSKKDVLKSEANLLRVLKIIKRYHPLRMEELKIKTKLHTRVKEIVKNIRKMETTLPKIKIPKILQEAHPEEMEEFEEIENRIEKTKVRKYDNSLEGQLEDIQAKLRELAS